MSLVILRHDFVWISLSNPLQKDFPIKKTDAAISQLVIVHLRRVLIRAREHVDSFLGRSGWVASCWILDRHESRLVKELARNIGRF